MRRHNGTLLILAAAVSSAAGLELGVYHSLLKEPELDKQLQSVWLVSLLNRLLPGAVAKVDSVIADDTTTTSSYRKKHHHIMTVEELEEVQSKPLKEQTDLFCWNFLLSVLLERPTVAPDKYLAAALAAFLDNPLPKHDLYLQKTNHRVPAHLLPLPYLGTHVLMIATKYATETATGIDHDTAQILASHFSVWSGLLSDSADANREVYLEILWSLLVLERDCGVILSTKTQQSICTEYQKLLKIGKGKLDGPLAKESRASFFPPGSITTDKQQRTQNHSHNQQPTQTTATSSCNKHSHNKTKIQKQLQKCKK
jgi:hypothetical protein